MEDERGRGAFLKTGMAHPERTGYGEGERFICSDMLLLWVIAVRFMCFGRYFHFINYEDCNYSV